MLILLMEPDDRERRRLSRALRVEGYSVCMARDSREAVRQFLAHPVEALVVGQPEPGLEGKVTSELLTALKPALPVIAVTSVPASRVLNNRMSIQVMVEKPEGFAMLRGVLRLLCHADSTDPRAQSADAAFVSQPAGASQTEKKGKLYAPRPNAATAIRTQVSGGRSHRA